MISVRRQRIRKVLLGATLALFQYRLFHLFFSPVLVVVAASLGICNGSLLIYGLLFLSSLYFGRAWCGWLCPGAAMNEACALVVAKPAKRGAARGVKYIVSAVWGALIVVLAICAGGIHSVEPFFAMGQRSVWQDVLLMFGAIAIVFPMSLLFGRFASCHYLCWQAPFLIIGARIKETMKWPALHLAVTSEACTECGTCDRHCPMSLPVAEMVRQGRLQNVDCILCGNCVDRCRSGAIRYSFAAPR